MKKRRSEQNLPTPAYSYTENDYNTAINRLNASIPSGVHL